MIRILVLILVFLIPIDLEFSVGAISGGGERVSNAVDLEDGTLYFSSKQEFAIKLSDLVMLMLFLILAQCGLKNTNGNFLRRIDYRMYRYPLIFFLISIAVLIWNKGLYTEVQFLASISYLAKFIEASLCYAFFAYYLNSGGKRQLLFRVIIHSSLIAAIAGIINPFTGVFSGWLISDRIEFYGMQLMIFVVLTAILLSHSYCIAIAGVKRRTVWLTVLLLGVSVLLCGKRTVMLGLIVAFAYLFFKMLSARNAVRIGVVTTILLTAGATSISNQLSRTTGGEGYVWEGLDEQYVSMLVESPFSRLYGLDLSTAEHIGKGLLTLHLFTENPLFGIGFWGTPYIYDFLPDGIAQILIETGLIGCLLLALPVIRVWRDSGRRHNQWANDRPIAIAWKGIVIALLIMGLTANVVYIFKLLSLFLMLTALARHASMFPRTYGFLTDKGITPDVA